jgi:hypothetical protein
MSPKLIVWFIAKDVQHHHRLLDISLSHLLQIKLHIVRRIVSYLKSPNLPLD